jgi:peptidyl-prolyl cis-trans isomerase D
MSEKKTGLPKFLTWIMMGFVMVGLLGFGAVSFNGSIQSVGSVGNTEIPVDDYARGLQNELRASEAQFGRVLSFSEAQAVGIPDRVLSRLVQEKALENEAAAISLSVGDDAVRNQIMEINAFRGLDGQFDRQNYQLSLEGAGYTEAEFEAAIRAESARTLLQGAVLAGNTMDDIATETVLTFLMETRDFTIARLSEENLTTPVADPTDDVLNAYYTDNIANYTQPERKDITYAVLSPDMLIDQIQVDQAALQAEYDNRIDQYQQPERRLVERLVFIDQAGATDALSQITSGAQTFEDLVQARGLTLDDVDLGDVARDALDTAADAVFTASVGDIVGPFDSDLGPALFRVNGVLDAQTVTLEDARSELEDQLALDLARRQIDAMIGQVDDTLAAGATLEELEADYGLRLGSVEFHANALDEITAYPSFRQAAEAVTERDFPTLTMLEDGGIFALRLNEIIAPAPIPFVEARETVLSDWRADETAAALTSLGYDVATGAVQLDLATEELTGLRRDEFGSSATPAILAKAFELEVGKLEAISDGSEVVVVTLNAVNAGDVTSEDAATIRNALSSQFNATLSNDMYAAFARQIQARAGISLDQQALNAVHANFQ